MQELMNLVINMVSEMWYLGIFFLMALESSIFPVPSEAVMIPAWYLVQTWKLDLFLVIIAGWFWSLFWAIVNYFVLWKLIWKPFLLKYWKYFFITEKKYHYTEKLFLKNDKLYTFLGRLIPVVRHLISIPAWIFNMNFWYFSIITLLWATLWCIILVAFWFYFGEWILGIVHTYSDIANIAVALIVVVWFIYLVKKK